MILDYRGEPANPVLKSSTLASLADTLRNLEHGDILRRFTDASDRFPLLYDADGRRIDTFVSCGKIGDTVRCRVPMRFRSTDA